MNETESGRPTVGAIVLAAGSGARFGAMKQFVELVPGVRLVDAAIAVVDAAADTLIVVMHPDSPAAERGRTVERWSKAIVADGGASRLESVANGLAALDRVGHHDLVLVHDAAHPLASRDQVQRLVSALHGAGSEAGDIDGTVPVLGAVDVVKRIGDDGTTTTIGRAGLGSAQVPMLFRRTSLADAHRDLEDGMALEDSAAVEASGGRMLAVEGEVTNIHVVDDASLALARLIASATANSNDAG